MNAMDMAQGDPRLEAAIVRSRKLLHKKAMTGAVTSMVPIPGVDWLVDASLMTKVIPQFNQEFGLTQAQIARLDPQKQERIQKAIAAVGAVMVGRLVTKELVLRAARMVGMRLTTKQAVKYVPLAGQMAAAALGYTALRYLGEQHIRDCVRVLREAGLAELLPPAQSLELPLETPARKRTLGKWLGRPGQDSAT